MRINRLDLERYGKFSDMAVALPKSEFDFHAIVGKNEAGKSTIRNAILDLFYGIPARTPYAFFHPMNDLLLGASIQHEGSSLDFLRTKGNKNTLQDPNGSSLTEDKLAAFLGTSDRAFFSRMFGLDHERLVNGGSELLSASNDLGRILFESAAGIASLGKYRESLESQAGDLWTKRKAGGRAYYVSADELKAATALVKQSTVGTRQWVVARDKVEELEAEHAKVWEKLGHIKSRRVLLERIRRVMPHLRTLERLQQELVKTGSVPDLPESAGLTLSESEKNAAVADTEVKQYSHQFDDAVSKSNEITLEPRVLALAAEITELNNRRLQYRAYEGDIAKRQSEIDAQWKMVTVYAEQLGWTAVSEDVIRAKLPTPVARADLERLTRSYAALGQKLSAAERAEKAKRVELERVSTALDALPRAKSPLELQSAYSAAQKLGDFEARLSNQMEALREAKASEEEAYAELGQWHCDEKSLRAFVPPTDEIISSFSREQQTDVAAVRATSARIQDFDLEIESLKLEISQFQDAHHPVSAEQLTNARDARDTNWLDIKGNANQLVERAGEHERLVIEADRLADTRYEKVSLAGELQSKEQHLARLVVEIASECAKLKSTEESIATRTRTWMEQARSVGYPEIEFGSINAWIAIRERALSASTSRAEADRLVGSIKNGIESIRENLAGELAKLMTFDEAAALPALMLMTKEFIESESEAKGQRQLLERQLDESKPILLSLQEELADANEEYVSWHSLWEAAVVKLFFENDASVASVEATLEVVKKIDQALSEIRKTRIERIDAMKTDLASFELSGKELAEKLAPGLVGSAAEEIAIELAITLKGAEEAQSEKKRQQDAAQVAEGKLKEAQTRLQNANAVLVPLLERAGVTSNAELSDAIAKSDERRRLLVEKQAAEVALNGTSDGLNFEQIEAEINLIDTSGLVAELEILSQQNDELLNNLTTIAAQKQEAEGALRAIEGSANAAQAEGQRQEALAKMSDVVEQYIQVYAGARLLRWSIEQYREAKQGPMLALASKIFSGLTSGSFERLVVDFDSEPLKLQGRRPNGSLVDIDGMSEGTRDQLYLALRLAALDMHLGQAHALPFIADDLFVNFDDERAKAGFEALRFLSGKTQVIFLTHHPHLLPIMKEVFGETLNIEELSQV